MQETQVQSLGQEDPTFCRATKPVQQQLLSLGSKAWEPQLPSPCAETTEAHTSYEAQALKQEKSSQRGACTPQRESSPYLHN